MRAHPHAAAAALLLALSPATLPAQNLYPEATVIGGMTAAGVEPYSRW